MRFTDSQRRIMEKYVVKNGKKLRLGYTTGTCAAAAAKAAAVMLLTGKPMSEVGIVTPNGTKLKIPVRELELRENAVRCGVLKDGGDDPDVTHGALIRAEVSLIKKDGGNAPAEEISGQKEGGASVLIDGGIGVGRVTKPGLDQPVGAAAINSVPRKMITEAVLEVCNLADYTGGLSVIISVPEGGNIAKKTFNSSLGILGGISIIGTTGIVEPMSEAALVETTKVTLSSKKAQGETIALLTPGNYGEDFIKESMGDILSKAVQTSNFIGDSIDACKELGFEGFLLVGHLGKLVKIAGGMLNTHSKYGDCRMDIMAATAGACGLDPQRIDQVLDCATVDEALRIIDEAGLKEKTLEKLMQRILFILQKRAGENMTVGVVTFSKVYGLLAKSDNAQELMDRLRTAQPKPE